MSNSFQGLLPFIFEELRGDHCVEIAILVQELYMHVLVSCILYCDNVLTGAGYQYLFKFALRSDVVAVKVI
jgi:hypothetical protein